MAALFRAVTFSKCTQMVKIAASRFPSLPRLGLRALFRWFERSFAECNCSLVILDVRPTGLHKATNGCCSPVSRTQIMPVGYVFFGRSFHNYETNKTKGPIVSRPAPLRFQGRLQRSLGSSVLSQPMPEFFDRVASGFVRGAHGILGASICRRFNHCVAS